MQRSRTSILLFVVGAFLAASIAHAESEDVVYRLDTDTAPISAEVEDDEFVADGELAKTNYGSREDAVVKVGTHNGNQRTALLLRADIGHFEETVRDKIEGGTLTLTYKFASGNLPVMELYTVDSGAADWKPDRVTWESFCDDAGDPAPSIAEKIGEMRAEGIGGKRRTAEFQIPSSVLSEWVAGANAGLFLKIKKWNKKVNVETEHGRGPVLAVKGDFDTEFHRNVEGDLKLYGATVPRARLVVSDQGHDGILEDAFAEYNPDIKFEYERSYNNKFHTACELVMDGRGDLVLTGKQDWEWRATDKEKKHLRYVPVARQRVARSGEYVGGVEYAVLVPREDPSPVAQAFVDFLGTSLAEEALKGPNPYDDNRADTFVPPDTEIEEFERPDYWREKPWEGREDDQPRMVHGMDLHPGEYAGTELTEMKKMMMKGYNSVLYKGSEDFLEWAYHHGMMISNVPDTEQYAEVAGGVVLGNEDAIGHKLKHLYEGNPGASGKERAEHFKRALAQWPEWVRKKHGNLETVNERWGTSYESWDEIGMSVEEYERKIEGQDRPLSYAWEEGGLPNPRLGELKEWSDRFGTKDEGDLMLFRWLYAPRRYYMAEHPELLDWYRHFRTWWGKYYEDKIKRIKQEKPYLREDFLFATKTNANPYTHRSVEGFNCASWDHAVTKIPPTECQMLVDTVQTPLGWPVWNSEDHLYNHRHSTPRRVRNVIFRNYLMGQFHSTSFTWWKVQRLGASKRFEAAVKVRNRIRRHEPVFRAFLEARANADIAVLATEGNRAWNYFDAPRPEGAYLGGAVKAFGHVGALGRQWKYVLDEDVSPGSVGDLLIIAAPWLRERTVEKIADLPDDRRIVVVGDFPSTDEYGQPLPEAELDQLRDRAQHVEKWNELQQTVKPADGLSGPYTEVGEGKFWAWHPFRGRTRWSYPIPTPRLELRRVKYDGKLYVAIINHADTEVTASLP
ncbi:MAG: hypothetical protein ACOC0A_04225, partial [Planctomycetota bacterium]